MRILKPTSYRWLWTSTASGGLSGGVSLSVLPLLMTTVTRSPLLVSLLEVASNVPWLLFGLQAGALTDRWDRARVLFAADVARALLAAGLVVVVALHALSVVALLAFSFAVSLATILFRSAGTALLPSLVTDEQLPGANGRLQAGDAVTGTLVGPSLGSVLFTVAYPLPVVVQAVGYGFSSLCLRRLPRSSVRHGPTGQKLREEVADGLRHIWNDRTLRTLAGVTTLQGVATWMFLAIIVLYSLQVLHAPAALYGVLATAYAIGGLLGTVVAAKALAVLGERVCLSIGLLVGGLGFLAMANTHRYVVASIALVVFGFAALAVSVIEVTVRQRRTPDDLLGRMSSAFNVLSVSTAPVSAPVAGLISARFGIPTTLTVCGVIFFVAALGLAVGLPRRATAELVGTAEPQM